MPIANSQDAREVGRGMQNILAAPNIGERLRTIRSLFVKVLNRSQGEICKGIV